VSLWNHFTLVWYKRVSPRLQLSWHNRRGSTCRGINEQLDSKDAARAISRESEELKELLEKELRRLENNETFAVNDFQKGRGSRTDRFVSHGQWACKCYNTASIEQRRGAAGPRQRRVKSGPAFRGRNVTYVNGR